jgi:hypothetical protein
MNELRLAQILLGKQRQSRPWNETDYALFAEYAGINEESLKQGFLPKFAKGAAILALERLHDLVEGVTPEKS